MQRKTFALIDGDQLKENVEQIKNKYPDYQYYIGVVKNNAYHHGIKSILNLIEGGINYLAVSSLEEVLQIRKYHSSIPILCLEPIPLEFIDDVLNANITLTVESLEYLENLLKIDLYTNLKVHLKIDSGMHRLGLTSKEECEEAVKKLKKHSKIKLEGIYSHFATLGITDPHWDHQVASFLEITSKIDLKEIPIVHFGRSATLVEHPKLSFCNGIRLGIVMYGFSQSRKDNPGFRSRLRILKRKYLQKKNQCSITFLENDLHLKTAFSLYSSIMSVRKVTKGDVVGYNTFVVKEDGYIYTLPIGYADGVTQSFKEVSIDHQRYPIVSDAMDMIMIFGKDRKPIGTQVEIFGEDISISEVCRNLNQNAYHLLNQISNRVVRVHKTKNEKEEIYY